eukprot:CAMPEP_0197628088 /NCGR_PEP_ID=MMETSP1338-20131121/6510_1 /TAXON_ID=43686 ORGANISM="Pelagodinium beii, Strain RCC1491" /NCGR_SAMPLE_ID=MMETSP1338 /ASSEMBLY_ACC=CAM_ASM_000754 /LENGTH=406 /DNA_ID=CAMNT_0043198989 /DNA_START=148 /DNA_END=1368 /DNA_ORIENTATION=-
MPASNSAPSVQAKPTSLCSPEQPSSSAKPTPNRHRRTFSKMADILKQLELPQYLPLLLRNGVDDLETLLMLKEHHMKEIGIPIGHILKIQKRLRELAPSTVQAHSNEPSCTLVSKPSLPKFQGRPQFSMSFQPEMINSVKKSWVLVVDMGMGNVAEKFYKNLFKVAPVTKELFPLAVRSRYQDWQAVHPEHPSDPSDSQALRNIFVKILDAVGTVVAGLQDMPALLPHLTALGMRHANYNMKDEDFAYGGQAIILTLKEVLGVFLTAEVEFAWVIFYDFMAAGIIKGLHTAQEAQEKASRTSSGKLDSLPSQKHEEMKQAFLEELGHQEDILSYRKCSSHTSGAASSSSNPSYDEDEDALHWPPAELAAQDRHKVSQPENDEEMPEMLPNLLEAFALELRTGKAGL